MNIAHWREYYVATDPATKRRILDLILADNENFIVANVHRLIRRGLVSPMSSIASSPLEDLIQAGRLGYMKALEKFDPEKGAFPTYAQHWIRHEVQQAALVETTIRKPKDSGLPYAALKKMDEIRTRFGRDATAEELGVSEADLSRWRTDPVVHSYMATMHEDRTFEADEYDGSTGGGSFLSDFDALDPEQLLGLKDLHGAVDRLPEQERAVIKAMFFSDRSIAQILNDLRMSCSTLYEVRDAALVRLRAEV